MDYFHERTMSVNDRESPPRVSSMYNFFLERVPNPKNFCCLGQKFMSQWGPSKN
jgi:hypothetical protein